MEILNSNEVLLTVLKTNKGHIEYEIKGHEKEIANKNRVLEVLNAEIKRVSILLAHSSEVPNLKITQIATELLSPPHYDTSLTWAQKIAFVLDGAKEPQTTTEIAGVLYQYDESLRKLGRGKLVERLSTILTLNKRDKFFKTFKDGRNAYELKKPPHVEEGGFNNPE